MAWGGGEGGAQAIRLFLSVAPLRLLCVQLRSRPIANCRTRCSMINLSLADRSCAQRALFGIRQHALYNGQG
jgi:hypothetical protein